MTDVFPSAFPGKGPGNSTVHMTLAQGVTGETIAAVRTALGQLMRDAAIPDPLPNPGPSAQALRKIAALSALFDVAAYELAESCGVENRELMSVVASLLARVMAGCPEHLRVDVVSRLASDALDAARRIEAQQPKAPRNDA